MESDYPNRKKSTQIVSKLLLLLMLLVVSLIFFISFSLLHSANFNVKTKAQSNLCVPGNCLSEPPCCAQILVKLHQLGDVTGLPDSEQPYHACPWNENDASTNYRAFCLPSTCNQLPSGIAYRGHCGWYWSFHDGETSRPQGYGCMIGPDANTMRPICGGGNPNPTTPPQPTTPLNPTQKPNPTQRPQPTATPYQYPSVYPSLYPSNFPTPTSRPLTTVEPFVTQPNPTQPPSNNEPPIIFPTSSNPQGQSPPNTSIFPNPLEIIGNIIGTIFEKKSSPTQPSLSPSPIVPPQLIPTTAAAINQNAPKSLDLFQYLFEKITYYDNLLNQDINDRLKNIKF